jgi:periplasmic copper chaperone A
MKKFFVVFISLFISQVIAAAQTEHIEVTNAYVRGLPPGVENTAAFMTLHNTGREDLVLTGGQADFVESVSIHASENNNGMMSMVHKMNLTIPAGEQVVLESGGLHLMLSGLKRPLDNEEVSLTLEFQQGMTLTLRLPVISVLDE